MKLSLFKKTLPVIIVSSLSLATVLPVNAVKAQESKSLPLSLSNVELVSNVEIVTPFDYEEFDLAKYVEEMEQEIREATGEEFSAEIIDGTKVLINSIDSENNPIEMIIDSETSETIINGENIGEIAEIEITRENQSQPFTQSDSNTFTTQASSDWDPVYQYTMTTTVKKITGEIGKGAVYAALFIGSVVSIVTKLGFSASLLLTKARDFFASIGLAGVTTMTGDLVNGKWSYDLYRTKKQVSSGGSTKQYAYRYQNSKFTANFKIGNYTTPTWTVKGPKTGGWWYGSRPY